MTTRNAKLLPQNNYPYLVVVQEAISRGWHPPWADHFSTVEIHHCLGFSSSGVFPNPVLCGRQSLLDYWVQTKSSVIWFCVKGILPGTTFFLKTSATIIQHIVFISLVITGTTGFLNSIWPTLITVKKNLHQGDAYLFTVTDCNFHRIRKPYPTQDTWFATACLKVSNHKNRVLPWVEWYRCFSGRMDIPTSSKQTTLATSFELLLDCQSGNELYFSHIKMGWAKFKREGLHGYPPWSFLFCYKVPEDWMIFPAEPQSHTSSN